MSCIVIVFAALKLVYVFLWFSAWIHEDLIWSYVENRDKYKAAQRPSRAFLDAVEKADEVLLDSQADKVSLKYHF